VTSRQGTVISKSFFLRCVPVAGIQGQDIGDVKFNQDGDAMGRYSVYQYQQVENTHDPKGEKRFVRRARYVRDAHTDRVYVHTEAEFLDEIQAKVLRVSSRILLVIHSHLSTALP
jgi:hypothetical protein